VVDQLCDLFRRKHKVKTQQVVKNRGQYCGDIELSPYLANLVGPVLLVLDLLIDHDRFGSSSDPNLNGHLHYPKDIDRSLNETVSNKIRKYRVDLLFLQDHRETDRFFVGSGVQLAQTDRGQFRRSEFSSHNKSRVRNILPKTVALHITLNLDGAPIVSQTHTHLSHSQTSHLLTSSLSLWIPQVIL
jgi:hypothetical protein